jgi:putative cardiolipin synthase
MRNHSVSYSWGRASILSDHPDKVLTSSANRQTHLSPQLRTVVDKTKRELFLVSPYFIPGKEGVALLSAVRQRGARVVVITNSLSSTDGVAVHSKYQRYRKQLLQAGVELYELKATPAGAGKLQRRDSRGRAGSSSLGLHAKTFTFDRRIGFIGSFNLDPRSSRLNTEMGVLYESPELARGLPGKIQSDLAQKTYRVELEANRLTWVTREGENKLRFTSEPKASFLKRLEASVLSWLPIEWLL